MQSAGYGRRNKNQQDQEKGEKKQDKRQYAYKKKKKPASSTELACSDLSFYLSKNAIKGKAISDAINNTCCKCFLSCALIFSATISTEIAMNRRFQTKQLGTKHKCEWLLIWSPIPRCQHGQMGSIIPLKKAGLLPGLISLLVLNARSLLPI